MHVCIRPNLDRYVTSLWRKRFVSDTIWRAPSIRPRRRRTYGHQRWRHPQFAIMHVKEASRKLDQRMTSLYRHYTHGDESSFCITIEEKYGGWYFSEWCVVCLCIHSFIGYYTVTLQPLQLTRNHELMRAVSVPDAWYHCSRNYIKTVHVMIHGFELHCYLEHDEDRQLAARIRTTTIYCQGAGSTNCY